MGDGAPWDQPGWGEETEAWIDAALAAVGEDRTGPVTEVRKWSISAVLDVPTAGGGAVFKQVPPLFGAEGRLLQVLDRLSPGSVPRPLAVDDDIPRWLMTRIPVPAQAFETPAGAGALGRLATVQRACAGHGHALLEAGCPDRRLPRLAADITALAGRDDLLPPEPRAELQAALPELHRRIALLDGLGLPDTVVHGDFHPWNAVEGDDGFVLFDWTDGALGNPLLDLGVWTERVEDPVAAAETYFAAWSPVVPVEELRAAWPGVEPLSCLHYAIGYQRIVDGVDDEGWDAEVTRLVTRALSLASGDG